MSFDKRRGAAPRTPRPPAALSQGRGPMSAHPQATPVFLRCRDCYERSCWRLCFQSSRKSPSCLRERLDRWRGVAASFPYTVSKLEATDLTISAEEPIPMPLNARRNCHGVHEGRSRSKGGTGPGASEHASPAKTHAGVGRSTPIWPGATPLISPPPPFPNRRPLPIE
jgi:hypothetical protein